MSFFPLPTGRLKPASPPLSLNGGNSSLLLESYSTPLTPLQSQVDGLVGSFTQQATDWRSLAAMVAGGMTYRLGRVGAMAAGTGRIASVGIGLSAEVTAFEMSHRSLSSLTGDTHANPNLWRWEGQGGIRQGLLNSFVTFGALKGAGRLAQGENIFVQHLLQDTGMVLGHQVSGTFGITDRPQGTLAEQFLHAEATNLQLGAGMALAFRVAPGLSTLERGLELSLRSRENPHIPSFGLLEPALSLGAGQRTRAIDPQARHLMRMTQANYDHLDSCTPGETDESTSITTPPPPSLSPPGPIPRPGRIPQIPPEIDSFESLVEQEPVMVIVTDTEKKILYANTEAHRVMGDGLVGRQIEEFLDSDQAGAHPQYRLRTGDGKDLLWEDRQHPFILNYTVHYFLDVTGRAESERLQEELVRLRIQAGEGFLARGLAHDVRSALQPGNMVIDQLTRLVQTMGAPDPEVLSRLPEIYRDPLVLLSIVKASLEDASNILEVGRRILRGGASNFSLQNVILDALHQNIPLRTEKNIQLHTEIQPHLGLYGNAGGIAEALRNILDNACQAMPQGGLLTVKAHVFGRQVIIEIRDTGVGIPKENLQEIFLENFTTKGSDGSGLGLPMAKKIIEEFHGGKIQVESEMDQGSLFRIILPHMKSDPPQAPERT